MSVSQSSVYLRNMIRRVLNGGGADAGDSLQNINTADLPDGAFCYVTETKQRYRFRKFATDAAIASVIVVPSAGGGRWFVEGPPTSALPAFFRATSTNDAPTGGGNVWVAPDDANFERVYGSNNWALTAAGCILTYTGPQCIYLMRAVATLTFPTPDQLFFGLSFASDLTGTDAGFAEGVQFTTSSLDAESSESFNMVTERIVVINSGEVVQPKFRLVGGASPITIERFTLSATPVL